MHKNDLGILILGVTLALAGCTSNRQIRHDAEAPVTLYQSKQTRPAWVEGLAYDERDGLAYLKGWVDDAKDPQAGLEEAGMNVWVTLARKALIEVKASGGRILVPDDREIRARLDYYTPWAVIKEATHRDDYYEAYLTRDKTGDEVKRYRVYVLESLPLARAQSLYKSVRDKGKELEDARLKQEAQEELARQQNKALQGDTP